MQKRGERKGEKERERDRDRDRPDHKGRKRPYTRQKNTARFQIPPDTIIDYKNVGFLQRYVTDRGKILSRRLSGVNAKEQRKLCMAIQKARFLALLPTGGVRK